MLSNYPIKINNVAIPFPDTWSENQQKIVNEFETESGGRKEIVVRTTRLKATATFTVTSRWLKKFLEYRDLDQLSVAIFDAKTDAYVTHAVSILPDSFRYSLIEWTKYAGNTNGLYKLQFDIEEF